MTILAGIAARSPSSPSMPPRRATAWRRGWVGGVCALCLLVGAPMGVPAAVAQPVSGLTERLAQSADFREVAPVLRQAAGVMLEQPLQLRSPMSELMPALTQLMAADQALRQALRQRLAQGTVAAAYTAYARNLVELPLDAVDAPLAEMIRQAETRQALLGPDPARSLPGDQALRSALMTLQADYERIAALSALRAQLTGPMAGPLESIAAEASWQSLVQERRQAQMRVDTADVAVLRTRLALQERMQQAADAVEAQAARERDEVMAVQRRLAQQRSARGSASASNAALTGVQALLTRRLQDLDRIAPRDTATDPAWSARSALMSPLPWAADAPDGLGSEWRAVQGELGRHVRQWADATQRLAPRWRERSRLLVQMAGDRSDGVARDTLVLVDAEASLLESFDRIWRLAGGGAAPERLADAGLILEELAGVEVQLAQATRMLAEDVVTAGDIRAREPAQALTRMLASLDTDLRAFDVAAGSAGVTWERFEAWFDRLLAARSRMWSDLAGPQAAKASGGAAGPLNTLPAVLQRVVRERADDARSDETLRGELRRAWQSDPIARVLTGRRAQRPWSNAAPLGDFIAQALRELVARRVIADSLYQAVDGSRSEAVRAAALVALVDPLTLQWDIAPTDADWLLRVDLGGATLVVTDLTRAAPRLELQPAARSERLVLMAAADGGSGLRSWLDETDPSKARPQGYQKSIVYSIRRSWLSYTLIAGIAAVGALTAGPVVGAGVLVGLGMQAVKDIGFGSAHAAVSASSSSDQDKRRYGAYLEKGEFGLNLVTGVGGAGKSVYSGIKAWRQASTALQMAAAETQIASASYRLAAADQTRRLLQQAAAGGDAAARARAAVMVGSEASDLERSIVTAGQMVRSQVARSAAGLEDVGRSVAESTRAGTAALNDAVDSLDKLRRTLEVGTAAQGIGGAAAQTVSGTRAPGQATKVIPNEPDIQVPVARAGLKELEGHGAELGGAAGDLSDVYEGSIKRFVDRDAQRGRQVLPPGSAGAATTTTATATTTPAIGQSAMSATMTRQFEELQNLRRLQAAAAPATSVAASAAPRQDTPIIIEPPGPGDTKRVPEPVKLPSTPASAPTTVTTPAKPVAPTKPPTAVAPATPAVPDLLAKPTDDYLWFTWSNCPPPGGWWCSLRLTQDRESHLRQRAELNKQTLTIFKRYASREAALQGICADTANLWIGGEFSCGLIGKIYGGDYCVGEFVLFNGDTKAKSCRR